MQCGYIIQVVSRIMNHNHMEKDASLQSIKDAAAKELEKGKAAAEKEIAKLKKTVDESLHKAEVYAKKNPAKAAAISAGIGAALGAALALLIRGKKK